MNYYYIQKNKILFFTCLKNKYFIIVWGKKLTLNVKTYEVCDKNVASAISLFVLHVRKKKNLIGHICGVIYTTGWHYYKKQPISTAVGASATMDLGEIFLVVQPEFSIVALPS